MNYDLAFTDIVKRLFHRKHSPRDTLNNELKSNRRAANDLAPLLVGTIHELRNLVQTQPPTNVPIILTGELVMVSDDPESQEPQGYIRQPDRLIRSPYFLLSAKQKNSLTIKVWVHASVLPIINDMPRHRVYLAVDQYLRFGSNNRQLQCIVSGHSANDSTIVTIYNFKAGILTSTSEKILPARDVHRFASDFQHLIDTLLRASGTLTIAAPLPPLQLPGVTNIENAVFKRLHYLPISDGSSQLPLRHLWPAITVILIAVSGYVLSILMPYEEYASAQQKFRTVADRLPDNTGFGANQLKIMQQRRFALTDSRPQESAAALLTKIAQAAAQQNFVISTLSMNFAPESVGNPAPDLSFTLQVARQPGTSIDPLDIAKPILERFSASLNMPLHLAQNGYRTENKDGRPMMIFTIEANLKNHSQSPTK